MTADRTEIRERSEQFYSTTGWEGSAALYRAQESASDVPALLDMIDAAEAEARRVRKAIEALHPVRLYDWDVMGCPLCLTDGPCETRKLVRGS